MPAKAAPAEPTLRDRYPNSWIPQDEGDTLEGTVVEVVRAYSDARAQNGDGWYPLLQVDTGDGILAFHAFSAVSYNRVMELQPLPGEQIRVTYQGVSQKSKPGQNPPKLFHISVAGRDPVAAANAVYGRIGDGFTLAEARKELDTKADAVAQTFGADTVQEELPY